jgi:hypothetical protein
MIPSTKTKSVGSNSHVRQRWRKRGRCVYTWIEGERAIFGPAARFCPAPGGTEGAKTNYFRSSSRMGWKKRRFRRCVYTWFQSEQTIFGHAARFCPAPGSAQRGPGPANPGKINKFRSSSRMRQKRIKFGRCVYTWIEGERAIFGPAARFCPAPGGTEGAKTNYFRSSSRMRWKWRRFRRCVYTWFQSEQTIFGPAARLCPAPGSAQRGPGPANPGKINKFRSSSRLRRAWGM